MKRVYFSAYVPINEDNRLPQIAQPPMLRENRLYQADWLMRFYGFEANELLEESNPNFDPDYDPKIIWAVRHGTVSGRNQYCILSTAHPSAGLGIRCAKRIVSARKTGRLDFSDLRRMHISLKRAQYFITCKGLLLSDPGPRAPNDTWRPKAQDSFALSTAYTVSRPCCGGWRNVEVLEPIGLFSHKGNSLAPADSTTDLLPVF